MGKVQLIIENCIVYYDETSCGACSEHCPTQAVHMVPYKDHLTIPETDPSICVGCGGCESVCPAVPFKSIYVEGISQQNIIEIEHKEVEEIEIEGLGFYVVLHSSFSLSQIFFVKFSKLRIMFG